jgi:hypothetical protein
MTDPAIERPCARTAYHYGQDDRENQKMELKSLTALLSQPIHKKAVLKINHQHSNHHRAPDTEGRDPRQETDDQSDRSQKLRTNLKYREKIGNTHLPERFNSRVETGAVEPAKGLLRAVYEENDPDYNAKDEQGGIMGAPKNMREGRGGVLILRHSALERPYEAFLGPG